MPDNDYIKLRNGEKFYFKNRNGEVKVKDFSNLARSWGVFFDDKYSENLTSREINVIFDKVKEYAMRDGKKSFSKTEMEAFINDIWAEQLKDYEGLTREDIGLNAKSLVQFLTELQEKLNNSGENVGEKVNDDIYNQILESFPEIKNREFDEGMHCLETDDGCEIWIYDGQIKSFKDGRVKYEFDKKAVVSSQNGKIGDEDFSRDLYVNGEPWRSLDDYGNTLFNYRMLDLDDALNYEFDVQKVKMLLNQSYQKGQIGQDMDDYFKITGRELFNDIGMSDLPEDVKEDLLDKIYGLFDDTRRYNPELFVENSQLQNDYYTGDEYSVRYNGPVVNIYNKTTNEETRLNLQKVLQLGNFDRRQKSRLISEIQELPAEVLENLAIEIAYIEAINKSDTYTSLNSDFRVGAYYTSSKETMSLYRPNVEYLIHELGHAIDNIYPSQDIDSGKFASSFGRFKAKYDELVTRYEAKGNKRFDAMNPPKFSIFKRTDNYMTYNELEGFAICFQAMMGCEDSQTRFLFKEMPELMDYAIEHYRHIRSLKQKYRFRNLSEMRNDN